MRRRACPGFRTGPPVWSAGPSAGPPSGSRNPVFSEQRLVIRRFGDKVAVLVRVGDMLAVSVKGDHQQERPQGAWKAARPILKAASASPGASSVRFPALLNLTNQAVSPQRTAARRSPTEARNELDPSHDFTLALGGPRRREGRGPPRLGSIARSTRLDSSWFIGHLCGEFEDPTRSSPSQARDGPSRVIRTTVETR